MAGNVGLALGMTKPLVRVYSPRLEVTRVNQAGTPGPQRRSVGRQIGLLFEILSVRLRFVFLMVAVGLVVGYWDTIINYYDRWTRPEAAPTAVADNVEFYCPMHPNVLRDAPANCPICGMPLTQRKKGETEDLPEGVLARRRLSPQQVRLGRITTSPVSYELLSREIRTVGIVEFDESRRAYIAARMGGRIDELLVNFVGQAIEQGAPLARIYSPDLIVAQEELLVAQRRAAAAQRGEPGLDSTTAGALLAAARQKLSLWGITDGQIAEILARGSPDTHLTIFSPIAGIVTEKGVLEGRYVSEGDGLYTIADLSRVWMQAKIFEDDIAGIEIGTAVAVTSNAFPAELFAGRITFIAYTVDGATRTIAARVEVDNPELKLRPGMYATAVIRTPVGRVHVTEPAPASAASSASDDRAPLDNLLHAYLDLSSRYVQDVTDDSAAARLTQAARALSESGPDALRAQAASVARAGAALAELDLKAQRTQFEQVSAAMIELLKSSPSRPLTLQIAHCPMVDADWLQESTTLANPYMGQRMLQCGSITETLPALGSGPPTQVVSGYFCPVYPERLFEKPELCPIDQFPMRFVQIEKVLAVPVSAIIQTGTRHIVYRESSEDTFEMLAVQVGPRAGEYYPVLSGLSPGDRVATSGAFLVDAENRLNPAAASIYFGASGNNPRSP